MNSSSPSQDEDTKSQRSCTDCQTTTTPLWRSGPAGPRSLCNACGIRHRKKRRNAVGLDKGEAEGSKKKKTTMKSTSSELGVSLNQLGLMAIQRGITAFDESMLKEEEQAAIMLMALSSESVDVFA